MGNNGIENHGQVGQSFEPFEDDVLDSGRELDGHGIGLDIMEDAPGDDLLLGQADADTLDGGEGTDKCRAGNDPADAEHSSCEK